MGLLDLIFKPRASKEAMGVFKTLTAYQPVFTSWNGSIYESELVRASIDAIARNVSKLKVEFSGSARPSLMTRLRKTPNEWQTWSQFLYRLSTIWAVDNTAFIVPVYDRFGDVTGVFPVLPRKCEIVDHNGRPWLKYSFNDGRTAALPMSECGMITRFQYGQDFFGSSNEALKPTMALIDIQNQGIREGIKNAATFRFMAQLNNFADDEDIKKERLSFNKTNLQGEGGGLLLFSNRFQNIQHIDAKPFVVDAEQMKLIQTNVYNYFGTNEDVIQSKAYGDKWTAFYESVIEVFSVQFSEVMTKMLFTEREQAFGSGVMATANRLQYMSNADKLNVSSQMLDRGILSRNEVREIWNLPPIENGDDHIIRGEYYSADEKLEDKPAESEEDNVSEDGERIPTDADDAVPES